MTLLCTETCITLIYILDIYEARNFLRFFFIAKGITLDEGFLLFHCLYQTTVSLAVSHDAVKMHRWGRLLARASSSAKVTSGVLARCADLGSTLD